MDTITPQIEEKKENICFHCSKNIQGKPWISVRNCNDPQNNYHGCSYLCGIKLDKIIGSGYWKHVINKEDFNEPRPVYEIYRNTNVRKDITSGFDLEEIQMEMELENMEDIYYSPDENTTSEEELYEDYE
jgi:hypothetical protein